MFSILGNYTKLLGKIGTFWQQSYSLQVICTVLFFLLYWFLICCLNSIHIFYFSLYTFLFIQDEADQLGVVSITQKCRRGFATFPCCLFTYCGSKILGQIGICLLKALLYLLMITCEDYWTQVDVSSPSWFKSSLFKASL